MTGTMGAITKTISQAMTLAGILVLALVIYTGYVLPVPDMHPWFGWIRYISKFTSGPARLPQTDIEKILSTTLSRSFLRINTTVRS